MSSKKKKNKMERGLTNRHVQVMAIAGTIGTGLFLGAGRSISLTGPSIVLIYMITGAFMFLMMRAVGEMLYQDPEQHTFINFITRHLGKGWGYFSVLVLTGYPLSLSVWRKSLRFLTMFSSGSLAGQVG